MGKSRALTLGARTIRVLCCAALFAASASAWAGRTTQVALTATMDGACSAFAVPLDFGTLPAKTFTLARSTTLQVRCPPSTTVSIGIDNGRNYGGGSRRMVRQGGQAKWLPYDLYKDLARLNRWGSTGTQLQVVTTPADGATLNVTIYGFTSGNVGSGGYTDTVAVTLTY